MANETLPTSKKVGSRREVYTGKAQITAGGLTKNDLFKSERGQIKSIRASFKAKNKFTEQCKNNPEFYKHWQAHRSQLILTNNKNQLQEEQEQEPEQESKPEETEKHPEYINGDADSSSVSSKIPESTTKGKQQRCKITLKRKEQDSSSAISQPTKRKAKNTQITAEK